MSPTTQDAPLREQVLAAALDILETSGVGALSMREVARRAGVSHQAPYHHFTDRADVLAELAVQGFDLLTAAMTDALGGPGEPAEACFLAYVGFARSHPGHFRLMFRPELCMVETHPAARAAADRAMGALMMLVRRVAPVAISETEAFDWAVLLWSQVHGTATLLLDGPLARKMPAQHDVDAMVASVARLASRAMTSI